MVMNLGDIFGKYSSFRFLFRFPNLTGYYHRNTHQKLSNHY